MVPCCAHAHVALSQSSTERHFCLLPPIPRLLLAVVDAAVSNYASRMLSAPHPIARAFTRSMCRRAVADPQIRAPRPVQTRRLTHRQSSTIFIWSQCNCSTSTTRSKSSPRPAETRSTSPRESRPCCAGETGSCAWDEWKKLERCLSA